MDSKLLEKQKQIFIEKYPDLIKHLVVNDMVDVQNPDISITARTKELYYSHLFPDMNVSKIEKHLKNKNILDIGCGYNPLYDESLLNYIKNKPEMNTKITGMDIIDMDMPDYTKQSVLTLNKKKVADMVLINNLLYFWINKPKDLLTIFKNIHRALKPGGEVRVFPVYMDNFTMDSDEVKEFLNKHFYLRSLKPTYVSEDPFYQDKLKDEIYVLEGLGEHEVKINKLLGSTTLILKKA